MLLTTPSRSVPSPSQKRPWARVEAHSFVFVQVFPPKTDPGTSNLIDRLDRMSSLSPTWVHVTWGAGGSTQARSLDLAGAAQGLGLDTCLHLTCTNMEQKVLDGALSVSFPRRVGQLRLLQREGTDGGVVATVERSVRY